MYVPTFTIHTLKVKTSVGAVLTDLKYPLWTFWPKSDRVDWQPIRTHWAQVQTLMLYFAKKQKKHNILPKRTKYIKARQWTSIFPSAFCLESSHDERVNEHEEKYIVYNKISDWAYFLCGGQIYTFWILEVRAKTYLCLRPWFEVCVPKEKSKYKSVASHHLNLLKVHGFIWKMPVQMYLWHVFEEKKKLVKIDMNSGSFQLLSMVR